VNVKLDNFSEKAKEFAKRIAYALAANEKINFNYEEKNISADEFDYFIRLSRAVVQLNETDIINCLMELPSTFDCSYATVESIQMNLKLFIEQWLQLNNEAVNPGEFSQIFNLAAYAGITSLVDCFLKDERIDPTADDYLVVHAAAVRDHKEIIDLLIKDGRIIFSELLKHIALSGNVHLTQWVINELEVVPTNLIFQEIVHFGKTEMLDLFMNDKRIDPSANNDVALINAVKSKNFNAVQMLVQDPRVDPSQNDNEPLQHCLLGETNILELLLKQPKLNLTLDRKSTRLNSSHQI
jgi:hypothetical protein